MSGWIKLHRQIVNSSKFADPDILRLWILCLTKASHKETVVVIDKREVPLTPGQFITGRFSLHQDYNALLSPRKKIPETTLWNWLKRLESWGDLDIKTTNKYSVVTVLKWNDYQETLTADGQQIDNRLTANGQQIDTNKNVKNLENEKNVINITTTTDTLTLNPFKLFVSEGFGTISYVIAEHIGMMIDDYGERWVVEAMKSASIQGVRTLRYVEGILKRYKSEGIDEPWKVERKTVQAPKRTYSPNKSIKPTIPTVSSTSNDPISSEELAEIKALAKKFDREGSNERKAASN